MTESVLGSEGNDSYTAPAFKGLPREIGDEHRLLQIFKKRAIREAENTWQEYTLRESWMNLL